MTKLKIGDVVLTPSGSKWEVIGVWVDAAGRAHYWVFDGKYPYGANDDIEEWPLKPTFFEEQASYRSTLNDEVITVCFVHQMAKGFVAVAQSSKGEPHLMHERHFRFWEKL
jgi:hypothetical protein